MNLTTYELSKIINHLMGGVAYTPVTNWYMGLSTTAIDETGAVVTEPSAGDGYARVAIPNDKTHWTTSTSGSLTSASEVAFPESTASWGNIVSIFLSSASGVSASPVCYFADAEPSFPVVANTIIAFDPGTVNASIT